MNVATTLIYFPMLLLSGAIVPVEIFTDALQAVAHVLPLVIVFSKRENPRNKKILSFAYRLPD